MIKIFFIILIIIFHISCSRFIKDDRLEIQGASYCIASKIHFQNQIPEDDDKIEEIMKDPILTSRFSPKSIRLAIAYGFWKDLGEFIKLEKQLKNGKPNLEFIILENKISHRIQLMALDINSTSSEFGCFVDRFTEILAQMKEKEDDIVQRNTLYAIINGAIFSIIDGGTYYNSPVNVATLVFGGLIETYFAYKAYNPLITIEFKPKSSNLKDIWYMPKESKNFSSGLWFVMTKDILENDPPIREILIKRWDENGFLGDEDDPKDRNFHINLFFGTGGISNITHITNRREMNNEVKTLIETILQEINELQIEITSGKKQTQ